MPSSRAFVPPSHPVDPYPFILSGPVVKGFGRGSKQLGIPTANIEPPIHPMANGIYFGFAKITENHNTKWTENRVFEMVMSVGFNPHYNNKTKSAEIHIIHEFGRDFYGEELAVAVCGYMRPELAYSSTEALIEDIQLDIQIAKDLLGNDAYTEVKSSMFPICTTYVDEAEI